MTDKSTPRWQVRDRYGNSIYMTAERWQHAVKNRDWLADYLEQTLDTLRLGRRKQDPMNPNKYKYYRECQALLPDYNHLVVIVLFGERETDAGDTVSTIM